MLRVPLTYNLLPLLHSGAAMAQLLRLLVSAVPSQGDLICLILQNMACVIAEGATIVVGALAQHRRLNLARTAVRDLLGAAWDRIAPS